MKKLYIPVILLALLSMTSCMKENFEPGASPASQTTGEGIESIDVAESFDWQLKTSTTLDLHVTLPGGSGYEGLVFDVYQGATVASEARIGQGVLDDQGRWLTPINVAAAYNEITVHFQGVGVPQFVVLPLDAGSAKFTHQVGGLATGHWKELPVAKEDVLALKSGFQAKSEATFAYHGTYDGNGVPDDLLPVNDVLEQELMDQIDASLPEGKPVPQFHPQYIADGVPTDLRLGEQADVWFTFVHEGAGYRNAVGYYTYDLSNPPSSVDDIAEHTVLFPNLSFSGSGGGLVTGNKIFLGTFPANTGIGWFLVANGWNGSEVSNARPIYYSNPAFNPESVTSDKNHNVLLRDDQRDLLLIGFEDINRSPGANSDQDFNDAIFYLTATPYEAVIQEDVPTLDVTDDDDGDGISDLFDDYPGDASRAFNNYSPAEGTYGTLAYEDLWPSKGDYDYNDLVIDYQFNEITNQYNQVVEMVARFQVRGIIAGYQNNAFAFQMDVDPNVIASVNGQNLTEGLFTLSANGTESGQSKAVIPVFDYAGKNFTSAENPSTIEMNITLSSPYTRNSGGFAPFNPFIIVNQDRGVEVHLPGFAPTDLVDPTVFASADDITQPGSPVTYYKTNLNLPWAIDLPESFNYPQEGRSIETSYLKFSTWATSGGFTSMDWYQNKSGYRDWSKLTFTE